MSLCAECGKEGTAISERWRGKDFCSLICLRCYQADVYQEQQDFMQGELVIQQIDAFFDKD